MRGFILFVAEILVGLAVEAPIAQTQAPRDAFEPNQEPLLARIVEVASFDALDDECPSRCVAFHFGIRIVQRCSY